MIPATRIKQERYRIKGERRIRRYFIVHSPLLAEILPDNNLFIIIWYIFNQDTRKERIRLITLPTFKSVAVFHCVGHPHEFSQIIKLSFISEESSRVFAFINCFPV